MAKKKLKKSIRKIVDAFAEGIHSIRYPEVNYPVDKDPLAPYPFISPHTVADCSTVKTEKDDQGYEIRIQLDRAKLKGTERDGEDVHPDFEFSCDSFLKAYPDAKLSMTGSHGGCAVRAVVQNKKKTVVLVVNSTPENECNHRIDTSNGRMEQPGAKD